MKSSIKAGKYFQVIYLIPNINQAPTKNQRTSTHFK